MSKNIKYILLPLILTFFVLPNITGAQTVSSPECQSQVGPLPAYCNIINKTVTTSVSKTICDGYMSSNNTVCITPQLQSECSSVGGRIDLKTGDCIPANQSTKSTQSKSSSYVFLKHNLMIGLSKDTNTEGEVSSLQSFLKSAGVFNNSPTGYFGKETALAVKNFQGKTYSNVSADDIDSTLVPSLSNRQWLAKTGFFVSKTGYVGSFTRAKIKYVSSQNLNTSNNTSTSNVSSNPSSNSNTQSTSNQSSNSAVTTTQISSNTSYSSDDLCVSQGLHNIDETNFSVAKNIVRTNTSMPYFDERGWGYKMNTGESYSFPIDTSKFYKTGDKSNRQLITDPYLNSSWYVFKISDRKCDFTPPKAITYTNLRTQKTYTAEDQCFGQGRSGEDDRHIVASAKYADPNYVFTTEDSVGCKLATGKKYYLNVRWIHKSDIVDENGDLRDMIFGEKPSASFDARKSGAGFLRQFFSVHSLSELNKSKLSALMSEKFNRQGDTCLGETGTPRCVVDWRYGWDNNKMPKFTPQGKKESDDIYANALKHAQEYQRLMDEESARKAAMTPPDTSPIQEETKEKFRAQAYGNTPAICEVGPCFGDSKTTAFTVTKYTPPSGQKPGVGELSTSGIKVMTATSIKSGVSATHYLYYLGPRTKFCMATSSGCVPNAQLGTGESSGWTMTGELSPYSPTWKRTKVLGVGVPAGTVFYWNFFDPDTTLSTSLNITITQ